MESVKGRRLYNTVGRREQARRSREAVIDAAQRRFLAEGYSATTIANIAADAGVSAETIYKSFGGKSGLVRAIYERGLAGRGPTAAYERSDRIREEERDPRALMRAWGLLVAEVGAEVTPIRLLMRSAGATDASIAELLDEVDAERLVRMRHHARFLKERGYLREGVGPTEAADILWTCSSAELFELLVIKRRWPQQRFAGYIAEFMIAALLAPPGPADD